MDRVWNCISRSGRLQLLKLRVPTRKAFSFPIENNTSFISHLLVNWKRKQTRCRLFEAEIVWGKHFVLQVGKIRCLRVWRVQDWRMWRGGCVVVQMIAALTFCTLLHLRAAVHSAAPRVPPTYHSRPFTGLFCNSYSNIYYRSAVALGLCKSTAFKLGAEILGARRRQWLREERIAVWSISQLPRNFVSLDMVYRRRSI